MLLPLMALTPSVIYTTFVVRYKVVKQDRIRHYSAFDITFIQAVYTFSMWMCWNDRFVLYFIEQIVLGELISIMRGRRIRII